MNTIRLALKPSGIRRPAFTLHEMICVLLVAGFALGLVTQVFRNHLQVNRRLTISAASAAASQSFTQRIRGDLLAAASFTLSTSKSNDGEGATTVAITAPSGLTTYAFQRVDRRAADAEGDPAIDQLIVRTDTAGIEHRWTLPAQTLDVAASPAAPSRILTIKFKQNGRSSAGFNRRDHLEMSLLTGGMP